MHAHAAGVEWGVEWGEKDYFRIARNKTEPGVCGVQTYVCCPKSVSHTCTHPNKPGVCPH